MPKTPEGREEIARELGRLLKLARGRRQQGEVASAAGFSDSTLSRFERGDHVPDLVQARALDEILGTGEVIQEHVRQISFNPIPAVLAFPRQFYTTVFPAFYVGPVYIHLSSDRLNHDVRIKFRWGAWRRDFTLKTVDSIGMAMVCTNMNREEHPSPLRVETSKPLRIAAGYGLPLLLPDERVVDCHDGWEPA